MVKVIAILLVIILCVLLISSYLMRKNAERKTAKLHEEISVISVQYEKMIQQGYTARQIMHDMQKQWKILSQLPDSPEIEQVMECIIETYEKEMKALGISFRYRMDSLKELNINEIDFLGIVLNLLDNAMEACAFISSGSFVEFEIWKTEKTWKLVVQNSKKEDISALHDGKWMTTKEDKQEHGYGTQIMREIVERLDGTISFEDKGGTFVAKVLLPIQLSGGKE